ncbi:MAG TPA: glycosyltransferase [Thermoanaerobaculia bacterium]|jgi:glycosyltransferase involved in cell wall biosynthesis|nr:glycosyltransferase [Thermoanaerobaculia bacterium]
MTEARGLSLESAERNDPRARAMPAARPHIVHVVGTAGIGGVQNLIFDLAASPEGRRYRHTILCLFPAPEEFAKRYRDAGIGVEVCTVPWPDWLDVGSYRVSQWLRHQLSFTFPLRFARVLRGLRADLVHTHVSHRIDLQADGALLRAGLPLVWTIHGQYRPEGRELERWRHVTRLAAGRPSAITAVAEELARDFRARGLDHPDGIHVTRGGTDLKRFASRPRDPAWRAHWRIPSEAVLLGAAGRLVPEKAYEVFIAAAARLAKEDPRVHFVIAGGGPLKEFLASEIERVGLSSRFQLVGFEHDVPFFLSQIDVFVLSSRFEGFPIALIEALASGLPSIATPVGGVPELLGSDGGLIVAPESEEELAAAMRTMLDARTRAAFGSRGPAIASRFSIERSAEGFTRLYARLLGESGLRSRGASPKTPDDEVNQL